jgi:predicted dienelactone hydrolase
MTYPPDMHGGVRGVAMLLAVVLATTALGSAGAAAATRERGVQHVTMTFVDSSRPQEDPSGARSAPERTIVTEIYVPKGKGPFPLVVFAHGNAGNPGKLTRMLGAWAKAGYVVVAPTFPLTNDLNGARSVTVDFTNQPADVRFVLDKVLRRNRKPGSPLRNKIDPRRIGLAGHSLGGGTAYGVAFQDCCRDRRIDAVVAMDAVRLPFGDGEYEFRGKPLLLIHLVGDPVVPYKTSEDIYAVAAPPKYLMALQQGIHFEPFEDAPSPHDDAVIAATTAFWDAYLGHRDRARRRVVRAGTEPGLSTVTAELR